jgi:UDP-N-acetylglucosamine acyltransferase
MAVTIHPTALIEPGAYLGENTVVGPFAVIESDVVIGDACSIGPHALIASGTRMGNDCRIFNGASVGTVPQDLKFGNEKTLLTIGNATTVREFCTLNRGTHASGETVIGSNCLFMAYCHVAHDCRVGDFFVAANAVSLAGHVTVGNHVVAGGVTSVVQFRKIGDYAFLGAYSLIVKDVVPFANVAADPVRVIGINKVGLQRKGFDEQRRRIILRAYKTLFRSGLTLAEATVRLERDYAGNTDIASILAFTATSTRGLLRMTETMDIDD